MRCKPALRSMRSRVNELLADWEDHPTLVEVITVIDRISAFPVTSPVMRYVTGLEVLVHKAQVWNKYFVPNRQACIVKLNNRELLSGSLNK